MSYTICSRFKGGHIVYAGYTICTSREHIVYGAFCGSTGHPHFEIKFIDFFASGLIKLHLLPKNVFDNYLYIAWKHIS